MGRPYFAVVFLAVVLVGVIECRYTKHLGCYEDHPLSPDLPHDKPTMETGSTPDTCATECAKDGFAFSGIMDETTCRCGMFYGKYEMSTECNYTCGVSAEPYCGGINTNSIYYSVDSDPVARVQRIMVMYSDTPVTYEEARKDCVKRNGDLAHVTSDKNMNEMKGMADELAVVPAEAWIGLQRRIDDAPFEWADPTSYGVDYSQTRLWSTSEAFLQNCVVLVFGSLRFETRDCATANAYVCRQMENPADGGAGGNGGDGEGITVEPEEEAEKDNTVFYVIMPLFIFCYGGSCLVYAIGKTYRYCKRRRKEKRQEERMLEFEPDTKPIVSKNSPPPPYYKLHRGGSSTPVQPLLAESPAGTFGPSTRQRTPPYANSVRSAPYREPEIKDDESTIDFSKLSIQDIIYIKSLMGERRTAKKKRKILVA